jgi:hypothetical protein
MSKLLSSPQFVELPSRNQSYPGNSLLINVKVDEAAMIGSSTEVDTKIEECLQEVLALVTAKWSRFALVGVVFVNAKGDKRNFIDVDAKSIGRSKLDQKFSYKIVSKG